MKAEVILLGKNFYNMDDNKGANVVVYGEYEETNNRTGVSISEAAIDYETHNKITVFPARYSANISFIGSKNRSGKTITSLRLSDLILIEELEFKKKMS